MPETNEREEFLISIEMAGQRLDKVLATHEKIRTRSRAAKLILNKKITRQGLPVKASTIVEVNDIFLLEIPTESVTTLGPYPLKLDVVYEDKDIIVINKPSGLVVHPAHGHDNQTLVNALIYHCETLSMGFAEKRPGIVHRLDKDTSGLIVAAKNDVAHESLAKQFKNKTVVRRYKALCYTIPLISKGKIESHLIRHPIHRKKFCSEKNDKIKNSKGKWAATNYELVGNFKDQISLIYCRLETGRTHQIRVHLSEMGTPIINDPIYLSHGKKRVAQSKELIQIIATTQRLGLHAFELGFIHPLTSEKLYFKQDWPDDLLELIEFLNFRNL